MCSVYSHGLIERRFFFFWGGEDVPSQKPISFDVNIFFAESFFNVFVLETVNLFLQTENMFVCLRISFMSIHSTVKASSRYQNPSNISVKGASLL